jgi:hypothetical protein
MNIEFSKTVKRALHTLYQKAQEGDLSVSLTKAEQHLVQALKGNPASFYAAALDKVGLLPDAPMESTVVVWALKDFVDAQDE